jgi:hypothetical protein
VALKLHWQKIFFFAIAIKMRKSELNYLAIVGRAIILVTVVRKRSNELKPKRMQSRLRAKSEDQY